MVALERQHSTSQCLTVPLLIPVSVTQKWKKIMMVNKLRQQWSPQLAQLGIASSDHHCLSDEEEEAAKRESKHTMSSIKWTVYYCNFSCSFVRFPLEEFALQVHLKALQVHKSDSQSVCICTQPNSCQGMSIFFNLPLYTILFVFLHFTTLMAVLDQPFESHTVQMSKVMHTMHISLLVCLPLLYTGSCSSNFFDLLQAG